MRPRRRWAFRILAVVAVPLVSFGLLEAGLRVGGYGYPTGFFQRVEGSDSYTANPYFAWRFFGKSMPIRQLPMVEVSVDKDDGAYRIFILGGSAAMGVPSESFGLGRILQAMLARAYPQTGFEVINVASTAINSHAVREISSDCSRLEPDMFVIYMGNNEVIGPFGVGTVFRGYSPNLTAIRAGLWLTTTRTGQLVGNVAAYFSRSSGPADWAGLDLFGSNPVTADDPRLPGLYDHFRRNLQDICRLAQKRGARVILCTVAGNLKDCEPFASAHRSDLAESQLATWDQAYQAGVRQQQAGEYEAAISSYQAAADIDDRFAMLHYRLGQCFLNTGRPDQAGPAFTLARDLDTLRVRADSRLNETIRDIAGQLTDLGVVLVDAENALAKTSYANAPGEDLFWDHCHMTFEGNYTLARAIFPHLVEQLPAEIRSINPQPQTPSMQQCAKWLMLTPWEQASMLSQMIEAVGQPPFTDQPGNASRLARQRQRLDMARKQHTPALAIDVRLQYEQALASRPLDLLLHENFAKFLRRQGDLPTAEKHARIVVEHLAGDAERQFALAQILFDQGKRGEAKERFQQAIDSSPNKAYACTSVAQFLVSRSQFEAAEEYCSKSLDIRPDHAETLNLLGWTHLSRRQWPQAVGAFTQALQQSPDSAWVHHHLGISMLGAGQARQSAGHFRKAYELDPSHLAARVYYARAMTSLGQFAQAQASYEQAIRTAPHNPDLRQQYGDWLVGRKLFGQALTEYRKALAERPDSLPLLNSVAMLQATCPDPDVRDVSAALEVASLLMELTDGKDPISLETAATVHAEAGQADRAVELLRRALNLAVAASDLDRANHLRQRLGEFQLDTSP